MQKAIIYARVSTSGQERDGSSLETQEERCREYAAAQGWAVVETFRETYSGASLWERPMLTAARALVTAKKADVLLCYALDRLSRRQVHIAILAEEVERAGGHLAFVTEDFEHGAVGVFLRNAKAFAAELEREKIAERTARGKMHRAQSGRLLPAGRVLYGYQWADASHSALIPNPATAPIVEYIFREIAGGMPMRRVAQNLTREGIPTATGLTQWIPATIRAIVDHPGYKGEALAMAWRRNGMRLDRDAAVHLPPGTIAPLVDEDTWDACQAVVSRNRARASRNNSHPEVALLRGGIAKCGHCGATMHVHRHSPSGEFRYRCGGEVHHPGTCSTYNVAVQDLDDAVWGQVRGLFRDGAIEREVSRLQAQPDTTAEEERAVERALAEIARKIENISHALAGIDDADVRAGVLAELKALTAHRRGLETELEQIAARWFSAQASRRALDAIRARIIPATAIVGWSQPIADKPAHEEGDALESLSYVQKRLLLDLLGVQVRVYRADHTPRHEMTANIPLNDGGAEGAGDIVRTTPRRCTRGRDDDRAPANRPRGGATPPPLRGVAHRG